MQQARGRFAPSPSGRMHLGNIFSALLAWLSVRAQGGVMVLRIEDLDRTRCRPAYGKACLDDLRWLGLDWDEGPYEQSQRTGWYDRCFERLEELGLVYPCYCTRAERLAASAPHREDGGVLYDGRCRAFTPEERLRQERAGRSPAWRIHVPDETISFRDRHLGAYREHLASDCGDFLIRRSDGGYAYQLAAAADDGEMGMTEVVRGADLLGSTARQIWLIRLLGFAAPSYAHVPLLLAPDGRRLSKRDRDLDMAALRRSYTPERIIGELAHLAGLLEYPEPAAPAELVSLFSWEKIGMGDIAVHPEKW